MVKSVPSTGSATRGADGDIHFLRWGSSGGLPVIVLAPMNVKDCYELTVEAFNLAEEFRCPVFIASNKEIAMTRESVDVDALDLPEIKNRAVPPPDTPPLPFGALNDLGVPYFLPIGGKTLVRQTSSTHGPDGYITTDPEEISQSQNRLNGKLLSSVERFSFYETYMEPEADTLVLSYGVTARAAKAVFKAQKIKGKPISLLILKTLWPIPEKLIKKTAQNFNRVIVVEMNLGQYVREVERILPDKSVEFIGQMDGRLINPRKIEEAIHHA